jgi:hypothetical protein
MVWRRSTPAGVVVHVLQHGQVHIPVVVSVVHAAPQHFLRDAVHALAQAADCWSDRAHEPHRGADAAVLCQRPPKRLGCVPCPCWSTPATTPSRRSTGATQLHLNNGGRPANPLPGAIAAESVHVPPANHLAVHNAAAINASPGSMCKQRGGGAGGAGAASFVTRRRDGSMGPTGRRAGAAPAQCCPP